MATPFPITAFLLLPAIFGLLTPSSMAENILFTHDRLSAGQALTWGPYSFIMQRDCNLVEYDAGHPIWHTNTAKRGSNCYVVMQSDGNLVVYSGQGKPLWASNTARGKGNYVCILQRDRNVVVYGGAIWATGTNIKGTKGVIISHNGTLPNSGVILTDKSDAGDISMVTN